MSIFSYNIVFTSNHTYLAHNNIQKGIDLCLLFKLVIEKAAPKASSTPMPIP